MSTYVIIIYYVYHQLSSTVKFINDNNWWYSLTIQPSTSKSLCFIGKSCDHHLYFTYFYRPWSLALLFTTRQVDGSLWPSLANCFHHFHQVGSLSWSLREVYVATDHLCLEARWLEQRSSLGWVVLILWLIFTLWLCQNSFGKWPFIVSFPIKNGDYP